MRFKQSPNINKTDYYLHGSMWLPQDIAMGDIIETGNGKNLGVILGFIYDTERLSIRTIHVAKITRSDAVARSQTALFISASATRDGNVSGIQLPAHIVTDRTSWYNPEDISRESYRIERVGATSARYFAEILDALHKNHVGKLPIVKENRLYVPSLQYLTAKQRPNVPVGLIPFGQIDDYDRALLIRDLKDPTRTKDGDQVHSEYFGELRMLHERWREDYLRGKQRAKQETRLDAAFHSVRAPVRPAVVRSSAPTKLAAPFEAANTDIIKPEKRQIIRPDTAPIFEAGGIETLQETFQRRAPVKTITLPKHLWQGRYLMLNIGELDKREKDEEGTIFHRPCAVWKAYADKDTGEIVGLELHPVTRNQAKNFKFKMPVYPLKTVSAKDSCLIADCIIRVPLNSKYFHENANPNFFELTPEKIARFEGKIAVMTEMGVSPQIVGLQAIPENWQEVDLDPTPSMQQLIKWASQNHIRFDGNLTDVIRDRTRERAKHRAPQ